MPAAFDPRLQLGERDLVRGDREEINDRGTPSSSIISTRFASRREIRHNRGVGATHGVAISIPVG